MKPCLTAIIFAVVAQAAWSAEQVQTIVDDAWQGAQGSHFSGRITEAHPAARPNDGPLASLYRNTRVLMAGGEEGLVTWSVDGKEWTLRSTEHGYWELAESGSIDLKPGWHEITSVPMASSPAGLLVVDPRNSIGIISDIDDTILVTDVSDTGTMLKNSLIVSPEHREAVPGMAELYRKLMQKNPAPESTPIIYLSASPRQLTDNIRRFLVVDRFPRGILQLRATSAEGGDEEKDHEAYKLHHIETILAAFPQLKFYFFGDDVERDPETYAKVAERHSAQVAGVWIHRINRDPKRTIYPGQADVRELIP
ncbi:MAG: phosphatase domain-containing protein [Lacunisphaera sp.]